MKFSQRLGITKITREIQLRDMDIDLKNSLWNGFYENIWSDIRYSPVDGEMGSFVFGKYFWKEYFKKRVDEFPGVLEFMANLKYEYSQYNWYEVYDFIQFAIDWIINVEIFDDLAIDAVEKFNDILKKENSGYRFVNYYLVPLANEQEIKEIEDSLNNTHQFTALKACNIHLAEALVKLSDKLNPDYRNSIKESISAVEAIGKVISGKQNDVLSAALDKIKGQLKIHSSLEQAFKKIYGYTSDSDGIRHGLSDNPDCDYEDAKFMLVACCAFINYLVAKSIKAEISLNNHP